MDTSLPLFISQLAVFQMNYMKWCQEYNIKHIGQDMAPWSLIFLWVNKLGTLTMQYLAAPTIESNILEMLCRLRLARVALGPESGRDPLQ